MQVNEFFFHRLKLVSRVILMCIFFPALLALCSCCFVNIFNFFILSWFERYLIP